MQWKHLGQGFKAGKPTYPYSVSIYWPYIPLPDPPPIALVEGGGFMSAGGSYTLQELLDPKWTDHLELCDCLYLRELAREEQQQNRVFTREEIWEKWGNRPL